MKLVMLTHSKITYASLLSLPVHLINVNADDTDSEDGEGGKDGDSDDGSDGSGGALG